MIGWDRQGNYRVNRNSYHAFNNRMQHMQIKEIIEYGDLAPLGSVAIS
jgi:hypothetical protein